MATEQKVEGEHKGTMRDEVNPACIGVEDLVGTEEEEQRNGHVEEGVIDEEDEADEEEEEEEIIPEHEPDKTRKVRRKDGSVVKYTIKEMAHGAMTSWMKQWSKRLQKKKETDEEFDKFLLGLICMSVYGPDGKLVTRQEARGWGHRLKFTLFTDAQEVNGLTDKVVKKEGKG